MFNLWIAIFLTCITEIYSQYRTNGVPPTQQITDIPEIQATHGFLSASSLGVGWFLSTSSFSIQIPLSRQYSDMITQTVITSGFEEKFANGQRGYFLVSSLTNNNTKGLVQLQTLYSSQIIMLKFTLIIITVQLQMTNSYIMIFERTVSSLSQSPIEYIQPFDLVNCLTSVFVQSMRASVTGTVPASAEMMDFRTVTARSSNDTLFSVALEKGNLVLNYDINVTYIIMVWNPPLYQTTARFVHLSFVQTSGEFFSSPSTLTIPSYNLSFLTNTIMGQMEWQGITTQQYSFLFSLSNSEIKYTFNTEKITYQILQARDLSCSSSFPYKYKGDQLCYSCPSEMIYINKSSQFNEYKQTINAGQCHKINIQDSGYNYNMADGTLIDVCGCCKECLVTSYLDGCLCKFCGSKITYCLECNGAGTGCTKCQSGYHLVDGDNNPATVNSVCEVDQATGGNTSAITCSQGYLPVDPDQNATTQNSYCKPTSATCSAAISNCLDCNVTTSCLTCASGYLAVGSQNFSCKPSQDLCSAAITNCIDCNATTQCLICASGFKLFDTSSGSGIKNLICIPQKTPITQNKLSTLEIVLISLGIFIFIAVIILALWCLKCRQKSKIQVIQQVTPPNTIRNSIPELLSNLNLNSEHKIKQDEISTKQTTSKKSLSLVSEKGAKQSFSSLINQKIPQSLSDKQKIQNLRAKNLYLYNRQKIFKGINFSL